MSSQLGSQLRRLQQRPDDSQHRLAKSFLFSAQDAQSFSREQIHQLALNGLQTLTAMDNRFHPFIHDLFDIQRVRQERSMLSSSEDAALRAHMDRFLTLLSPHFFLTAAQQVFEFLVRVYEVHIYDAASVLRAFLPYHDHNIFARALLLLDLRDTGFDFLATNQLRGAPLLREHLILACAESRKVARLVCLTVAMPFRCGVRHPAANALFASVVTQLVKHKDAEALWRTFLPFVLELLSGALTGAEAGTEESKRAREMNNVRDGSSRVSAESVATALVVLAAWSAHVRFSSAMLTTLLKPLFRYVTVVAFAAAGGKGDSGVWAAHLPVRDLLAFLELLLATQHRALADVAVTQLLPSLLSLPWRSLVAELPFAEATEIVAGPNGVPEASPRHRVFLATLLQLALDRLSRTSEVRLLPADVLDFLLCAAEDLPLSHWMVKRYLRVLLTAECGSGSEAKGERDEEDAALYHRMIVALERRYAVVFDSVLSEVLLHAEATAAATAFLARHFRGTRYSVVDVGSALAGTTESLPLFACLHHPLEAVRGLAAQSLERMPIEELLGDGNAKAAGVGRGRSLVDLLSHVIAYERDVTAAAAFVKAAASVLERLAALLHRETAETVLPAAQQLVRALYAMALTWLPGAAASGMAKSSSNNGEALHRVLLPLIDTILRPSLFKWTRSAPARITTEHPLRTTLLYHATLLCVQWAAALAACRNRADALEEAQADHEKLLKELTAVVESSCEGAKLLALHLPICAHGNSSPRLADPIGRKGAKKGGAAAIAAAEDDMCNDEEADARGRDLEQVAAVGAPVRLFTGLLQCGALLKAIQEEARLHLHDSFSAAHAAVREATQGPWAASAEMEIVMAVAAMLLPAIEEGNEKEALQVISAVMTFMQGTDGPDAHLFPIAPPLTSAQASGKPSEGYLNVMYTAMLDRHRDSQAVKMGRSAVDTAAAAQAHLYNLPLIVNVGLVLRAALDGAIRAAGSASEDGGAANSFFSLILHLCRSLGGVGARLPNITAAPDLLAPVYFELVDSAPRPGTRGDEGKGEKGITALIVREVNWYELVAEAVFANKPDSDGCGRAVVRCQPTTQAALALALFLPLRAPTPQRLSQLRTLQDAVVAKGERRGGSGRGSVDRFSGVKEVVLWCMREGADASFAATCTVTALSCLIECMVLEERQFELTSSAAALVCALLSLRTKEVRDTAKAVYVVPAGWAHRIVRYFFPMHPTHGRECARAASSASLRSTATSSQVCLIEALVPRLEELLEDASGAGGKGVSTVLRGVTADEAELVEAVCQRLQLWGQKAATEEAVAGNASVQMVRLLLRYPYLHVQRGGGARMVYRYALTALTIGLSEGLEDRYGTSTTIFTSKKLRSATVGTGEYAFTAAYQRLIATYLQPLVLRALDTIGTDVAVACMTTRGGYEYFFLPLLAAAEEARSVINEKRGGRAKGEAARRAAKSREGRPDDAEAVVLLQRVRELLEVLIPATLSREGEGLSGDTESKLAMNGEGTVPAVRWLPPTSTSIANPVSFADALRVLRLPSSMNAAVDGGSRWTLSALSLEGLRLLRTWLRIIPTIAVDDEEVEESAYKLVIDCVEMYPPQELGMLLRHAASSAAADEVALLPRVQQVRLGAVGPLHAQGVLHLVEALVWVCTEQTRLLSEKQPDGAYRVKSHLLRELMLLMARVLMDHDGDEEKWAEGALATISSPDTEAAAAVLDSTERRGSELRFNVDTIAGVLRAIAPLLRLPNRGASASVDATDTRTFLHVPLLSLLIQLERADNTEALGFRTAREVCQDILSSFDIRTQVQCLVQLMRLVADPIAQLASPPAGEGHGDAETEEQQRLQHLFRRMVKPNQVINRQEPILQWINLTVKSDTFLEPFLALQRRNRVSPSSGSGTAGRRQRPLGKKKNPTADEQDSESDEAVEEHKVEGGAQRGDSGCMDLLVSTLELFAHYHDLRVETRQSGTGVPPSTSTVAEEQDTEAESYIALLELLAGNTLACVLAGINEHTFVVCQQRLLTDKRTALHFIGLEVLLDRLHHSLPTLENVVSDEEMEAQRRRLRDPRQRLSLADLVRIKARPLTTKRSMLLLPFLVEGIRSNVAQLHASLSAASDATSPEGDAESATTTQQLLTTMQLGVASVEELIRIVGSGGSLQSEKTLLNAARSKRVTEAALVKLFGNRSRVTAVHDFVNLVCDHWMPVLTRCEMRLRTRGAPSPTTSGRHPAHHGVEEALLGCMTCLATSLATVAQVMGSAFTSAHSLSLLHTLVSGGVYQVVEMPGIVSCGEAGALLRRSTLSSIIRCFPACWQMAQPYLPLLLFIATHTTNVTDAESHYLCAEVLAVLEAVMEPQLLLDAGTACLQGIPYLNAAVVPASEQHQLATMLASASSISSPTDCTREEAQKLKKKGPRARLLRVQVHTHSFSLLFTCIERRIEHLDKEELLHMPALTEGRSPHQNFWLAAFQSFASAPSVPTSESVLPVLQAFTTFLLKFKAKHGVRLLRMMADWAFAESNGGVAGPSHKSLADRGGLDGEAEEVEGRGHDDVARSTPRHTLQAWMAFFALCNHLLGKLGSILDFAFAVFLPHAITTLRTYCAATATSSKATESLVALVLEGALESVRSMALAQTPGPDHDYSVQHEVYFANADVFPSLMPALVQQLHNVSYLEDSVHDYRFRVEHNVIPAIRAFMACLGSSKLQSKTQAEVVRALRHPSRHVRREALVCLDGIYADGGDELASRLMAEMLPTVVELTEDRDDAVVEEARKLCNNLSHMTGQDVLYAMS